MTLDNTLNPAGRVNVSKPRRRKTRSPELYFVTLNEFPYANEYSQDELETLVTSHIHGTKGAYVLFENIFSNWASGTRSFLENMGITECKYCSKSSEDSKQIGDKKRIEIKYRKEQDMAIFTIANECTIGQDVRIQSYINTINNIVMRVLINATGLHDAEQTEILTEKMAPEWKPCPIHEINEPSKAKEFCELRPGLQRAAYEMASCPKLGEAKRDFLAGEISPDIIAPLYDHTEQFGDEVADQLAEMPLTDLVAGPNPRTFVDHVSLGELMADVQANGMKKPIEVRPSPHVSGKYEVLDGDRRKRVAEALHWLSVKVVIKTMTDAEAYQYAFTANNNRKELSEYDVGRWLFILKEKFPERYPTEEILAKGAGLQQSTRAPTHQILHHEYRLA